MTYNAMIQVALLLVLLTVCLKPLGLYMARVYTGHAGWPERILGPLERMILRLSGVRREDEMPWQHYAAAVLALSIVSFVMTYGIQRVQGWLPLNPDQHPAVAPDSAFNTAVSFITNTNWQGYGGESTMSHLTQMLALTVQNFVSAAVGMSVLVALARGIARQETPTIGNFWVDLVRGTLYILLPLSLVLALLMVSQGVVQNLSPAQSAKLLEPTKDSTTGELVTNQTISLGPVASQVAIKLLGTNGGGFFNANSAHPFENPTPLSNLLQILSLLIIPAALCMTFGTIVDDRRQGWALLAAMFVVFIPLLLFVLAVEQAGNSNLAHLGVDQEVADGQAGGNMEGKETRFGITGSVLYAVATTSTSTGAVNAMHDSFTPLGGLVPMLLIQLGEVIFGGVGSGLYTMLVFALIAVFLAGLMVGRTPEYLGNKIGAFEMKMAAMVILWPCAMVLVGTALAVLLPAGRAGILNPGPHGFSEVLYAYSSAANNNGSAFGGLSANTPFYNGTLALAMLIGRFWVMLPILAIAGSIGKKKRVSAGPGTLPTHTPLFVLLLICVVVVVGALSFFPALALGPIAEHLLMGSYQEVPK